MQRWGQANTEVLAEPVSLEVLRENLSLTSLHLCWSRAVLVGVSLQSESRHMAFSLCVSASLCPHFSPSLLS